MLANGRGPGSAHSAEWVWPFPYRFFQGWELKPGRAAEQAGFRVAERVQVEKEPFEPVLESGVIEKAQDRDGPGPCRHTWKEPGPDMINWAP